MNPWLDSLSEDWVSQPRSSSPSLIAGAASTSDRSSVASTTSKTRIPHLTTRRKPTAAPSRREVVLDTLSENGDTEVKGILQPRDLNRNHDSPPGRSHGESVSNEDVKPDRRQRRISRTVSSGSFQTTRQHLVSKHRSQSSSPQKDRRSRDTPQWKRRLLGNDAAKRDLFGPIGLEAVFQPPSSKPPARSKGLPLARLSSDVPSSPPSYHRQSHTILDEQHSSDLGAPINATDTESHGVDRQDHNALDKAYQREEHPNRVASDSAATTHPVPEQPHTSSITNAHLAESSLIEHAHTDRSTSGGSEKRNEDISPIFISRLGTVAGKYNGTPHPRKQVDRAYQAPSSPDSALFQSSSVNEAILPRPVPNDSMYSTREFESRGGFINVRRGGYSNEGSFQRRSLSPSSMPLPEDTFAIEEASFDEGTPQCLPKLRTIPGSSEDNSDLPPPAPTPPPAPKTPTRSPQKNSEEDEKPMGSRSPLKLFGNHDTFTNLKLLRRMSQFETSLYLRQMGGPTSPDPNQAEASSCSAEQVKSRVSSFGQGQLDGYAFERPMDGNSSLGESFGLSMDDTQLRHSRDLSRTHRQPSLKSPVEDSVLRGRVRQRSSRSRESLERPTNHRQPARKAEIKERSRHQRRSPMPRDVESKRPPSSPIKARSTKRRRTLNRSDLESSQATNKLAEHPDGSPESHPQAGRKRKDARYDDHGQVVDPEVVAMRRKLKAKVPSATEKKGREREMAESEAAGFLHSTSLEHKRPPGVHETASMVVHEAQAESAAARQHVLRLGKHMLEDQRKGSVTTQDFLDEATKIMDFIRAKGRPQSTSASGDTSEAEGDDLPNTQHEGIRNPTAPEDDLHDSFSEEFSRPPSREGSNLVKPRSPTQLDPKIISHLQKYAETPHPNGLISSSMPSLHGLDKTDKEAAAQSTNGSNPRLARDGQPHNIRISSKVGLVEENANKGDNFQHPDAQIQSQSSNGSSERESSSRSDTKLVIAPDKVSHLIPGQVGSMTWDQSRKTWVNQKSIRAKSGATCHVVDSDGSEEDPLGNIPDLSVDEMAELRRIQTAAASTTADTTKRENEHAGGTQVDEGEIKTQGLELADTQPPTSRPTTREGPNQALVDSSSIPSKFSRLASSGPRTETRATSWGDDPREFAFETQSKRQIQAVAETHVERVEEVEHEIQAHEGREIKTHEPTASNRHNRRDTTITFSSPLVSHVIETSADDSPDQDTGIWAEVSRSRADEPSVHQVPQRQGSQLKGVGTNRRSSGGVAKPSYRAAAQRVSFGGRSFTVRPFPRIDEQNEDSLDPISHGVDYSRRTSMDVTIATPLQVAAVPGNDVSVQPTGARTSLSFHLSPLPDFTVNLGDETFAKEIGYLSDRVKGCPPGAIEGVLSQATATLIKTLTDVEPYEPYWDYLRQLDLRKRGLVTLHRLNEFCTHLEEADVSDNEVGQLSGVPSSIRSLMMARNNLSNLTAWGHLYNLQYLDISGNQLSSLKGLQGLMHLREIKADDNQISSLEGVFNLDGLTSLRARRNCLSTVDFETSHMRRLSQLDLRGNQLTAVENLQCLPALSELELGANHLARFVIDPSTRLRHVRFLALDKNRLEILDIRPFPELHTLYADENRLREIIGLRKARQLDTLSMREQAAPSSARSSRMSPDDCFELRKLYYSANGLPTFNMKLDFLNLQYLELVSAGLKGLPSDFGQRAANVRVLNLNFNALKDISPLRGITRLQRLLLAGNRLDRLRSTTAVLTNLARVRILDLRNNPLTIGFYPPVVETRVVLSGSVGQDGSIPSQDTSVFALPAGRPAIDESYRMRLDLDTKLRRRVYEMLVGRACGRLSSLDGLPFTRTQVLHKDVLWDRLAALGVARAIAEEQRAVPTAIADGRAGQEANELLKMT